MNVATSRPMRVGRIVTATAAAALIAGGITGDWVKGPLEGKDLLADFLRGIALHRAIDSYAETHPAFVASRRRCADERRRWSGILVDMFYDHLLARDWHTWHAEEGLPDFSARCYVAVADYADAFPNDAQSAFALMQQEDWLSSYATLEGLAAILIRMSCRARQPNPLERGFDDLRGSREGFAEDCAAFMENARDFATDWLRQRG